MDMGEYKQKVNNKAFLNFKFHINNSLIIRMIIITKIIYCYKRFIIKNFMIL